MPYLFLALAGLCSVGSLICFIMVVVKMFQNNQTGIGIACIIGVFVCGIGALVAFIYGWMKSGEWRIQQVMLIWSGCIVGSIVLNIIATAMGAALMPMQQ